MKYLIISDIHGNVNSIRKIAEIYSKGDFDGMIILGDILYHGPRNPVTNGYNPKEVAEILNEFKDEITAVRGNCEAEVDQAMLKFPCMSDYAIINDNGRTIFATHGHIWNPEKLPNLPNNSYFLYGHTHLYKLENTDNITICNPGSITLPKENRKPTFAVYNNGEIEITELI